MRRIGAWLTACAFALLVAACATTTQVEPRTEPNGGPIVTQHAQCAGGTTIHPNGSGSFDVTVSRDGTYAALPVENATKDVTWELYLPADWNKWWFGIVNGGRRLVVFHQGTIDPYNPLDLPNHSFATYNEVVCNLVASGIAVAWTSNTETGYDLEGAYRAAAPLVSAVAAHSSANPSRVYQVGFSQGGILGPAFLENDPALFDGALSICAPLDGMTSQLQYLGDARVLFDAYLQGNYAPGATTVLPTSDVAAPAFEVPEGAPPDGDAYLPWRIAHATHPNGTFDFDAIDYDPLGGWNLPAGIRDLVWSQYEASDNAALAYAGNEAIRLPAYTPDILTYATTEVLYYAVRGVNQLIRKAGGVPYASPSSFPDGTPGTFTYAADAPARNYVADWFDTTGDLQKRLLTLHTTDDPAVPFWHETAYRDRVAGRGKSGLLRQQWVQRVGHCALTQGEMVGALEGMIRWVEFGEEPPAGNVTSTFDVGPTVAIVSPSSNATIAGVVDVRVTASDDTGVARVEILADGATIGWDDAPELVNGQREWRVTWDATGLAAGAHTLQAIAYEAVASLPTGGGTPATATDSVEVQVQGDVVGAPPSITAFSATPSSIEVGSESILSWSTSGDGTLTLELTWPGGSMDVTGTPSTSVSPASTTAYMLQATSAYGSDTAGPIEVTVTEPPGEPTTLALEATPYKVRGQQWVDLAWTPFGATESVEVRRSDGFVTQAPNDTGAYTHATTTRGGGAYTYEVCEIDELGSQLRCSNPASVTF